MGGLGSCVNGGSTLELHLFIRGRILGIGAVFLCGSMWAKGKRLLLNHPLLITMKYQLLSYLVLYGEADTWDDGLSREPWTVDGPERG